MRTQLRPGFKADAERIAELVRRDLALGPLDRLDCFALAEAWGIPVVSLGELREDGASETSIRRLMSPDAGFPAATIVVGPRRLIVYNPRDESARKASSLAHELAHVILDTRLRPPSASAAADTGTAHRRRKRTGSAARCSSRGRARSRECSKATTSMQAHATSASASSSSAGASTTPASYVKWRRSTAELAWHRDALGAIRLRDRASAARRRPL